MGAPAGSVRRGLKATPSAATTRDHRGSSYPQVSGRSDRPLWRIVLHGALRGDLSGDALEQTIVVAEPIGGLPIAEGVVAADAEPLGGIGRSGFVGVAPALLGVTEQKSGGFPTRLVQVVDGAYDHVENAGRGRTLGEAQPIVGVDRGRYARASGPWATVSISRRSSVIGSSRSVGLSSIGCAVVPLPGKGRRNLGITSN